MAYIQQKGTEAIIARLTLLAVLAQHGGELEVTKGTMDQVRENFDELNWVSVPKPGDEQTVVVRLVSQSTPQVAQDAPSATTDLVDEGQANGNDIVYLEDFDDNAADASATS